MRWLPSVKALVQNVEIGHAHECAEGRPLETSLGEPIAEGVSGTSLTQVDLD